MRACFRFLAPYRPLQHTSDERAVDRTIRVTITSQRTHLLRFGKSSIREFRGENVGGGMGRHALSTRTDRPSSQRSCKLDRVRGHRCLGSPGPDTDPVAPDPTPAIRFMAPTFPTDR